MKMLKVLNAVGIFKNDEVWFPTYYTYNTMWNYSDASLKLAKVRYWETKQQIRFLFVSKTI